MKKTQGEHAFQQTTGLFLVTGGFLFIWGVIQATRKWCRSEFSN